MKFKEIVAIAEKNNKSDDLRDSFVALVVGALLRPLIPWWATTSAEHIADAAYAACANAVAGSHAELDILKL